MNVQSSLQIWEVAIVHAKSQNKACSQGGVCEDTFSDTFLFLNKLEYDSIYQKNTEEQPTFPSLCL